MAALIARRSLFFDGMDGLEDLCPCGLVCECLSSHSFQCHNKPVKRGPIRWLDIIYNKEMFTHKKNY